MTGPAASGGDGVGRRGPSRSSLQAQLVGWYGLSVLSVVVTILVVVWQLLEVRLDSAVERRVGSELEAIAPPGRDELVMAAGVGAAKSEVHRAVGELVLVSGLTSGVGAIGIWFILGVALRPLRETRDAALAIDETDLSARIEVTTADEVGQLGHAINRMLDRIEHAYSARIDFEDRLGHEIRTPLAIIRGQLEVFPDDAEGRAAAIRICREELTMIERDIDSLVVLAESRNPNLLTIEPVELADLTDRAAGRAARLHPDHDVEVVRRAEGTVGCDPQRILQALANLTNNACTHSPAGSMVSISSRIEGDVVRFAVRDRGPGLPLEEATRVFEPFQRGPASPSRGLGLGLNIVKIVAEAHGGAVGVESTPGAGATFWFTLRRTPAPPDRAVAPGDGSGGKRP